LLYELIKGGKMQRRKKYDVQNICSNCGKNYTETYGDYYSGIIKHNSCVSCSEATELEFQFCDDCSRLLSGKTLDEIYYALRDNKEIK